MLDVKKHEGANAINEFLLSTPKCIGTKKTVKKSKGCLYLWICALMIWSRVTFERKLTKMYKIWQSLPPNNFRGVLLFFKLFGVFN